MGALKDEIAQLRGESAAISTLSLERLETLEAQSFETLSRIRTQRQKLAEARGSARENDSRCVVCLEARKETTLVPCGHLVCCTACTRRLCENERPECPACRARIEQFVRTYGF
mmetsp:Transcript_41556/g.91338  ORF Transcript_41556/g.91338 Transcript_41556/m.91338 type:complete len:114 (+) Transcript_41556:3-344(+)